MDMEPASPAGPTPLAQFYARNPQLKGIVGAGDKEEEKYPQLLPIMRGNFR